MLLLLLDLVLVAVLQLCCSCRILTCKTVAAAAALEAAAAMQAQACLPTSAALIQQWMKQRTALAAATVLC
jgi:hypothetical protein